MRGANVIASLTGLVLFAPCAVRGQDSPKLRFEVASVKSSPPSSDPSRLGGGPGTNDPGWARYRNVPMRILVMGAYALKEYQFTGPSWLGAQKYDVEVKVPPGATREQFNVMLQDLLAERLGVKVHHETRIFSGYELVVAKSGSKLRTAEPPSAETAALIASGARGPAMRRTDKDGLPELLPGTTGALMATIPGGDRMSARGQGLERLVEQLELSFVKVPVRDATGLTGKYDFDLTFSLPSNPGAVARANGQAAPEVRQFPDIFTALQEQLGLKLEAKKLPIDVVVVDYADKVPTAN